MGKVIDITGKRFGRLVVASRAHNIGNRTAWECTCDCGNKVVCTGTNLKTGNTESCGCLKNELQTNRLTTHGLSKEPEYMIWKAMIKRCYNEQSSNYEQYGARGITVCDEWLNSFESFYSDMGKRPSELHSIDRIDVNGNYEPTNCKWASKKEQARNRRTRSKTGVTGVSFNKQANKYHARIKVEGKEFHLGLFTSLEEATKVRLKAEEYYWNKSS